jgi:hypothetical protein
VLSITLGLGLVLLGIYFNSLFTAAMGFFCMLLGLYSSRARPVKAAEKAPKGERRVTHRVIISEPPESTIMPWEVPEFPASAAFPKDAESLLNSDIKALKKLKGKTQDPKEAKEIDGEIKELEGQKKKIVQGLSGINFLPLPDYGSTDPLEKIFLGLPIRFLKKV